MKISYSLFLVFSLSCFAVKGQVRVEQNQDTSTNDFENGRVLSRDLEKSISNAVRYFENLSDVDVSLMYNYHYLQKKFEIKKLYPSEKILDKLNLYGDMLIYHNAFLYRLVDKSFSVSKEQLKHEFYNIMSELMLKSAYCDLYPVDNNFLNILEGEAIKGKYNLTHALLSLQWLKENGCVNKEDVKNLEQSLIAKHIELIESADEFDDLTIEAVAFVQYCGYHHLVKEEWIQKIIAIQQKDGGWKWNSKNNNTDTHPSISALWSLLEWQYPEKTARWIN